MYYDRSASFSAVNTSPTVQELTPLSDDGLLFALDFAEQKIRKIAETHRIDPAAVISAVRRRDTVGQFVLAMLDLAGIVPPGKRGRPRDEERESIIVSVVNDLIREGKTEAKAFTLAPKRLAERGIFGYRRRESNERRPMTVAAVRRVYKFYPINRWFDVIRVDEPFDPKVKKLRL